MLSVFLSFQQSFDVSTNLSVHSLMHAVSESVVDVGFCSVEPKIEKNHALWERTVSTEKIVPYFPSSSVRTRPPHVFREACRCFRISLLLSLTNATTQLKWSSLVLSEGRSETSKPRLSYGPCFGKIIP